MVPWPRYYYNLVLLARSGHPLREITEALDVSTWNVGSRFFYRIAPKTLLLTEIRHTEYDYSLSSSPLDSSEQRYLLGGTLDLVTAASGTIKLGYLTKRVNLDFATTGYPRGATKGESCASPLWKPHR